MSGFKGTWVSGNPPKEGAYRLWCQKGGNQSDPESNPWYSWWTGSSWGPTGSAKFATEYKGGSCDQFAKCQWKWLDEFAETPIWIIRKITNPSKPGIYKVRGRMHRDDTRHDSWLAYWDGLKWGGATSSGDPQIAMKYFNQGDTLESRADEWLDETPTQPKVELPKKRQVGVHRCHFVNATKEPRFAIWLESNRWSHAYATMEELRKRWDSGTHEESSLDDDGYIGPWPEVKVPEPKAKYIVDEIYTFVYPGDKKQYFVQFCEGNQFGLCEESYDAAKRNKKGVVPINGAEMSWGTIVPAIAPKAPVEIMVPGFYDVSFKGQKRVVVYTTGNGKCSGYSTSVEKARTSKSYHDGYPLSGDLFSDPRLLLAEMLDEEPKSPPTLKIGMYVVRSTFYAWWNGDYFGYADVKEHGIKNAYARRYEKETVLQQKNMIESARWADEQPIEISNKTPTRDTLVNQIKAASKPPRRKAPARRRILLLS